MFCLNPTWSLVVLIVLSVAISAIIVASRTDKSSFGVKKLPEVDRSFFDGVEIVPNQYVVAFRSNVVNQYFYGGQVNTSMTMLDVGKMILHEYVQRNHDDSGSKVVFSYNYVWKGVTISHVSEALLHYLIQHPAVKFIEEDVVYAVDSFESTSPSSSLNIPWNLDRIDQKTLPLDGLYLTDESDDFSATDLSPVSVFVLDSGIESHHVELADLGNSSGEGGGPPCVFNAYLKSEPESITDMDSLCNDEIGHGTHVAGIIAGKTSGVVKGPNRRNALMLYNVKVVRNDGSSSLGAIIAGIDFVVSTIMVGAQPLVDSRSTYGKVSLSESPVRPTVLHMSLGGPPRESIEQVMKSATAAGVVVVASAGNDATSTCGTHFPAGIDSVIAVGSTDQQDFVSKFSNVGKCVNIFAPGEHINSAFIDANSSNGSNNQAITVTMSAKSGTSTAAAHVTGAVVLYLQTNPTWKTQDIIRALDIHASHHQVKGLSTDTTDSILNILHAARGDSDKRNESNENDVDVQD